MRICQVIRGPTMGRPNDLPKITTCRSQGLTPRSGAKQIWQNSENSHLWSCPRIQALQHFSANLPFNPNLTPPAQSLARSRARAMVSVTLFSVHYKPKPQKKTWELMFIHWLEEILTILYAFVFVSWFHASNVWSPYLSSEIIDQICSPLPLELSVSG